MGRGNIETQSVNSQVIVLIPLGVKCVPHSIGRVALPRTVHNHLRKRIGETYKKKKKIKKREKYHRAKLADDFMRKTCMEAAPIQKKSRLTKESQGQLVRVVKAKATRFVKAKFHKAVWLPLPSRMTVWLVSAQIGVQTTG